MIHKLSRLGGVVLLGAVACDTSTQVDGVGPAELDPTVDASRDSDVPTEPQPDGATTVDGSLLGRDDGGPRVDADGGPGKDEPDAGPAVVIDAGPDAAGDRSDAGDGGVLDPADCGCVLPPADPCAGQTVRPADVTISTAADLATASCYERIEGSLTIAESALFDVVLPKLTTVTGDLTVFYPIAPKTDANQAGPQVCQQDNTRPTVVRIASLPSLASVGRDLTLLVRKPETGDSGALIDFGLAKLASVGRHLRLETNGGNLYGCGLEPREILGDAELSLTNGDYGAMLFGKTTRVQGAVTVRGGKSLVGVFPALTRAGSLRILDKSGFVGGFDKLTTLDGTLELTNLSEQSGPAVQGASMTALRVRNVPGLGNVHEAVARGTLLQELRLVGTNVDALFEPDGASRFTLAPSAALELRENPRLVDDEICRFVAAQRSAGFVGTADLGTTVCGPTCEEGTVRSPDRASCQAPLWTPPATLSSPGASAPKIALNSLGNALVAWQLTVGERENIGGCSFSDESWYAAAFVEADDSANAMSPQVVFDEKNEGAVVWLRAGGTGSDVWASAYREGWGEPVSLEAAGSAGNTLAFSFAGGGNSAHAVWQRVSESESHVIYESRLARGASWTRATKLSGTSEAYQPDVAVDAVGSAVAAWTHTPEGAAPPSSAASARFGNEVWSAPSVLDPMSTVGSPSPRLASTTRGGAHALWVAPEGVWDRDLSTSTVTRVASTNPYRTALAVAAGSSELEAVWLEDFGGIIVATATHYGVAGGWRTPQVVSEFQRGAASEPAVAVAPDGTTIVAWTQLDGGSKSVWARRYLPRSDRWTNSERMSAEGDEAGAPDVGIDGNNRALVVYRQGTGVTATIQARRLR